MTRSSLTHFQTTSVALTLARPRRRISGDFDPDAIYLEARQATTGSHRGWARAAWGVRHGERTVYRAAATAVVLEDEGSWTEIGETGAHALMGQLQRAARPDVHFHLMGHSFGCIVVSAAVAGAPGGAKLPRPVQSLFLVQVPCRCVILFIDSIRST